MNLVMECEFGNCSEAWRDKKTFLVDIDDYEEFVDGYSFYLNSGYVLYSGTKDGLICKRLHRIIMGDPEDLVVDHINGDPLDNRKDNLRVVTVQQNNMNQGINKNNKSGVAGVSWNKNANKWVAQISYKNKLIHLGCFDNLADAAKARKDAEKEYFGELARK